MNVEQYYTQPRINLTGMVGEKMIEDLDRQVKSLDLKGNSDPTVLTITSGGGSVGYARAIYEELGLLQQQTELTLVARGICLSSAVTIAMAVPQENRFATLYTKFLLHEGTAQASPISGPLAAREIQQASLAANLEDDKDEAKWVNGVIAEGCHRTRKDVERVIKETTWLVGKEAVKFGLVSALLKPKQ